MRVRNVWRVVLVVLLGATFAACAESDGSPPGLPDPGTDNFAYDGHVFDRGSPEARMRLLEKFRLVQRDFFAGDAEAVCASFSPRDPEFAPRKCVRDVERTMRRLADGDLRWPLYRVEWVRIYNEVDGYESVGGVVGYEAIGGVTLTGPKGKFRMAFAKDDGTWMADFAVPRLLEGLNTRLSPSG